MAISLCGGVLATSGYYMTGRRRPYGVPVPPYGRRPCVVCQAMELTEPDHERQRAAFLAARRADARDAETSALTAAVQFMGPGWRAECVAEAAQEELRRRFGMKLGNHGVLQGSSHQLPRPALAAAD